MTAVERATGPTRRVSGGAGAVTRPVSRAHPSCQRRSVWVGAHAAQERVVVDVGKEAAHRCHRVGFALGQSEAERHRTTLGEPDDCDRSTLTANLFDEVGDLARRALDAVGIRSSGSGVEPAALAVVASRCSWSDDLPAGRGDPPAPLPRCGRLIAVPVQDDHGTDSHVELLHPPQH